MDRRKTIAQFAGWITLAAMIISVALYFLGPVRFSEPAIIMLLCSSWLHGICWGYRYALEGRLTWL